MRDEVTEVPQEGESGEHSGEGHGEPDKSAKQTEDKPGPSRAEVSNYEIVEHWFKLAAERSRHEQLALHVEQLVARDLVDAVEARHAAGLLHVVGQRVGVDPVVVADAALGVGRRHDLAAHVLEEPSRPGPDVAVALHHHAGVVRIQVQRLGGLLEHVGDAAACRGLAAE